MSCQYNAYPDRPCTVGDGGDPDGMCRAKRYKNGASRCVLRNETARTARRIEISEYKHLFGDPPDFDLPYEVQYEMAGIVAPSCRIDDAWNAINASIKVCNIRMGGRIHRAIVKTTSNPEIVEMYKAEASAMAAVYRCVAGRPEAAFFLKFFFAKNSPPEYSLALQHAEPVTIGSLLVAAQTDNSPPRDVENGNRIKLLLFQAHAALAILHSNCKVVLGNADVFKMLVVPIRRPITIRFIIKGNSYYVKCTEFVKIYDFEQAVPRDIAVNNTAVDSGDRCQHQNMCLDEWYPNRDHLQLGDTYARYINPDGNFRKIESYRSEDGGRCYAGYDQLDMGLIWDNWKEFRTPIAFNVTIQIDEPPLSIPPPVKVPTCYFP